MSPVWTDCLYKRHMLTPSNSQVATSPPWPKPKSQREHQEQDCSLIKTGMNRSTIQANWWEEINGWSSYWNMEYMQDHWPSTSTWGSMQDLTWWGVKDLENNEKTAQNYTTTLVNDQKRAGTTVTNVTISNTQRCCVLQLQCFKGLPK